MELLLIWIRIGSETRKAPMPKTRLTDRAILSLKTDKVQEDHFDEVITGFEVRVFRTGRKSYFFLYRNENGQRRRFDIGSVANIGLADARQKARAVHAHPRRRRGCRQKDPRLI